MILNRVNGVYFFRFHAFSTFRMLSHAVFTRISDNGSSLPPFNDFNLARSVGDLEETVLKNRGATASIMNLERLVFANQVHGADSIIVAGDRDNGVEPAADSMTGDALITKIPNIGLCILTADCQAVMMFDPVKRVIANIHSGWRGSIQNVIGKTTAAMKAEFGSDPKNMAACVGPSMGPCCGEFINYRTEIPEYYWKYRISDYHFDFRRISRDQLIAGGLNSKNIEISPICTICNPHLFYSYRKETVTGRFVSVIAMKS